MVNMQHGQLGIGRWSILINNGRWRPRNFDILIIELLQYALQGRVSKVLLSVPRRHGKSTLISRNFASYFLSHFPNDNVILSSYSQMLASQFGKDCKNIIKEYGSLSPYHVELAEDSKANNKFNMKSPYVGRMLAVGAAGSIMGFGANLFIIDDPIKSPKEAASKTIQFNLEEWIEGVAKTCLETRTNGLPPIMIVIAQRLNINDLHGIIKKNEPYIGAKKAFEILRKGGSIPPDTWVDFNLPAICEDPTTDLLGRKKDEVLWKEQRSYEWLMAEKKAMGSYLFNAIYQGEPIEREGHIFKRNWFENCIISSKDVPANLPTIRYWDFAASGEEGDSTAGLLTSWNGETLYIMDLVYGKFTASQVERKFKQTTKKDGKHVVQLIEQEPGSGSKILINHLQHDPDLRGHTILADKVKENKIVRSFDLEVLSDSRQVKMVNSWWNERFVNQLVSFTGEEGNPDDIVDTGTGSARYWRKPKARIFV